MKTRGKLLRLWRGWESVEERCIPRQSRKLCIRPRDIFGGCVVSGRPPLCLKMARDLHCFAALNATGSSSAASAESFHCLLLALHCNHDRSSPQFLILGYFMAAFNVVSDFYLLAIPIPVVWKLQMPLRRKVGVCAIFRYDRTVVSILFPSILQPFETNGTHQGLHLQCNQHVLSCPRCLVAGCTLEHHSHHNYLVSYGLNAENTAMD